MFSSTAKCVFEVFGLDSSEGLNDNGHSFWFKIDPKIDGIHSIDIEVSNKAGYVEVICENAEDDGSLLRGQEFVEEKFSMLPEEFDFLKFATEYHAKSLIDVKDIKFDGAYTEHSLLSEKRPVVVFNGFVIGRTQTLVEGDCWYEYTVYLTDKADLGSPASSMRIWPRIVVEVIGKSNKPKEVDLHHVFWLKKPGYSNAWQYEWEGSNHAAPYSVGDTNGISKHRGRLYYLLQMLGIPTNPL